MNQSPEFEILDLGLVIYRNVIPEPDKVIDYINKLDERFLSGEHGTSETSVRPWEAWSYDVNKFCDKKYIAQAHQISPSDYYATEQQEISEKLHSSLDAAFKHYSNVLYPFAGKNIKTMEQSTGLLRYVADGFLPAHSDQGISSRVLSTVSYLNDDYVGGEIEFINSGVKVKPEAGSIIFFPSNFLYIHEVYPIISGTRYSMPQWFHNRKNIVESDGSE
jgi:predicted 2-oxoglutarate/Fe(II)-dependent dioxygenase YbiX